MTLEALSAKDILIWQTCTSGVQVLALAFTVVRLVHRWRIHKMWWDDWIVFIPLCVECVFAVSMWLSGSREIGTTTSLFLSPWFYQLQFLSVIWIARMSLALTLARIFAARHICRRFSYALVVLFFMIYLARLFAWTFECHKSFSAWYNIPFRDCIEDRNNDAIIIFTCFAPEVASDILLFVSPIVMLWKIRLPQGQRRLVCTLFASTMLTLFGTIALMVVWSQRKQLDKAYDPIIRLVGHIQAAISLLVSNLLVVVMLLYQFIKKERPTQYVAQTEISFNLQPSSWSVTSGSTNIESPPISFTTVNTDITVSSRSREMDEIDLSFGASSRTTLPAWSFTEKSQASSILDVP